MKTILPLGLVAMFGLAACDDTSTASTPATPAMTTPAMTGGDLNSVAANACRAAIAQEMNRSIADVAVFDVAESEAGVGVRATVAGAEAPWACQSSPSGVVAGVSYTGSEGAL